MPRPPLSLRGLAPTHEGDMGLKTRCQGGFATEG